MKKTAFAVAIAALAAGTATAGSRDYNSASPVSVISTDEIQKMQMPSMEEMWKILQQQNQQIHNQNQEILRLRGVQQQTDAKVEAAVDAVENSSLASVAEWVNDTSFGGYGELHYNNLENESGGEDEDEIDLHRFVLFFGHEFTDDVRFFSELEVEHSLAGDGKPGEVEIEQAYVEWDFAENHSAKAGVFLIPVGILNETHEPDTFYGVERNKVEAEIIPSTWWEGGLAVSGQLAEGLSYDLAAHSGLDFDGDERIRGGRQKVAEAKADNFAYTARLKYTGIKGLELAATAQYQTDIFQGEGPADVGATLIETHAVYQNGPFGLRALYAMWDFDSGINLVTPRDDADEREGFYIEPSYKLTDNLGIFARYSEYDEARAAVTDSMTFERVDFGVNYWVAPTVVLKADYQNEDAPEGRTEFDGFNLGVGWSF